jgi:pyruvate ferredoxin oxidoreductase beta subunit
LGVECGLVPLFEIEDGKITSVKKIKKRIPVENYLKAQGRFKHLFAKGQQTEEIKQIQAVADANIQRYGLLKSGPGGTPKKSS